ncbi:hypothetical protein F5Y07DRAFT_386209 [Xylaria sp. FL0933]|nr:hypothetical protein F5Y07DRAFT_386209 [Xylaria sp. FL0933]
MSVSIIYLTGATACGKGLLGKMLAESFGFSHVSIGELRRAHLESIRSGLPLSDERIRQCVREERAIPESLLAEFETVPAVLHYYNHRAAGRLNSWTVKLASKMLNEFFADVRSQAKSEGKPHQVVIVDGHPLTSGKHSAELVEMYATSYSGLTIVLESPREVSKKRYMERARQVGNLEERFEARMELTDRVLPGFLELMTKQGEVVHSRNEETMSPDMAFTHLLGVLNKSSAWLSLLEKTGNLRNIMHHYTRPVSF